MINWTKLIVRNAATREILTGADRIDALREFRARETMLLGTFERVGGAWETDEPHTWGPQFADDVDWSGFDAAEQS